MLRQAGVPCKAPSWSSSPSNVSTSKAFRSIVGIYLLMTTESSIFKLRRVRSQSLRPP